MKNKTVKLLKDLPNCPKGRIFKKYVGEGYYHYMTDEEVINNKMKSYCFSEDEIKNNPDWFELL